MTTAATVETTNSRTPIALSDIQAPKHALAYPRVEKSIVRQIRES
jgi:hypothetical protein